MSWFNYRFFNLLRLRATTPWGQAQNLLDWAKHTLNEADELWRAAAHQGTAQMEEEAGDTLANVLGFIIKLEEETQGKVTLETVMNAAGEKLKRRKPWMMGPRSGWPDTEAEEHAIWLRQKAKEKE